MFVVSPRRASGRARVVRTGVVAPRLISRDLASLHLVPRGCSLLAAIVLPVTIGCLADTGTPTAPPAELNLEAGFIRPLEFHFLTAGHFHTCAITVEGQAWCWGDNQFHQLGDGTGQGRLNPVPVAGQRRFAQLSGGALLPPGTAQPERLLKAIGESAEVLQWNWISNSRRWLS